MVTYLNKQFPNWFFNSFKSSSTQNGVCKWWFPSQSKTPHYPGVSFSSQPPPSRPNMVTSCSKKLRKGTQSFKTVLHKPISNVMLGLDAFQTSKFMPAMIPRDFNKGWTSLTQGVVRVSSTLHICLYIYENIHSVSLIGKCFDRSMREASYFTEKSLILRLRIIRVSVAYWTRNGSELAVMSQINLVQYIHSLNWDLRWSLINFPPSADENENSRRGSKCA